MDILKVLGDNLTDGRVIRNEVGKPQAPGAPVSTYLTDDELPFSLSLDKSLVYLLDRVDVLVIDLFQRSLSFDGDR
jgi:hypothetical protein